MQRIATRLFLAVGLLASAFPAPAGAAPGTPGNEPPRHLTGRGLENLTAFTRLLGYVRFFHPSDGVDAMTPADWDDLAIAGVQRVEGARNPAELAAELGELFGGIAPSVVVLPSRPSAAGPWDQASAAVPAAGTSGPLRWTAWRHEGVDLGTPSFGVYRSERVTVAQTPEDGFTFVYQDLDGERLRGHRVRLSAAARFASPPGEGQAFLSLVAYTFTNIEFWQEPITSAAWGQVELEVDVPADTFYLSLSFDVTGKGTLGFDDVRVTADGLDETASLINPDMETVHLGQPPWGWVNWPQVFAAQYDLSANLLDPAEGTRSAELTGPKVRPVQPPVLADLGAGVSAIVPLTLPADDGGTFPRPPQAADPPEPDKPAGWVANAEDRATRLAGVALAWSILQHFYPYFDVVSTDWPGALTRGLKAAATAPGEASYLGALNRLLAELKDSHARVVHPSIEPTTRFAFTWDLVEGQLVITWVEPGATHGMAIGDRVLAVDGRPVNAALADLKTEIPTATPQWQDFMALRKLAAGPAGATATLTVKPRAGGPVRTVVAPYDSPTGSNIGGLGGVSEPLPEKVEEVRPGIYYVDLSRIDDIDFYTALDQLAAADGIVFDLRGYPWFLSPVLIAHLIDEPVITEWFNTPIVTRPDRQGWEWSLGSWFVPPEAPRLTGRLAFLVDGRTISYAEVLMGIVEYYRLGDLVGGPTAGSNGNINPFPIPGGYTLRWTGMQVLKHDASTHHGVGIQVTVPAGRTLAGVLAQRDEVLEKGIEVVSQP